MELLSCQATALLFMLESAGRQCQDIIRDADGVAAAPAAASPSGKHLKNSVREEERDCLHFDESVFHAERAEDVWELPADAERLLGGHGSHRFPSVIRSDQNTQRR